MPTLGAPLVVLSRYRRADDTALIAVAGVTALDLLRARRPGALPRPR